MNGWNVGDIASIVSAVFVALAVIVNYWRSRRSVYAKHEKDGEWKGTVDTRLAKIDEDISFLRKDFSSIRDDFSSIRNDFSDLRKIIFERQGTTLYTSKSLLQLTDEGESVSEEIGALRWIEKILDSLKAKIKGKDAYEIQDFCFGYVEDANRYTDEEQRAIRNSAYKRGIKTGDIRRILAIELRDKLLEHAGLEAPEESHTE